MEIHLNEDEIREVLAEELAKKVSYVIGAVDPENCWFEAKADYLNGDDVEGVYNIKFCYKT